MLSCVDLSWYWIVSNWIRQSKVGEKFVVGESKQSHVELHEGAHYFVVNIEGQALVEFVGLDPCYRLAHYLDSVVDALYREESLCETLW